MKISDSVIMFADVTPNRLGMGMVTVEGTVYELDLRDLFIQKKLKLFFHQLQAAQADRFIYGRKTVAATVRAAAAGFVVNDTVVEIANVLFVVEKGMSLISVRLRGAVQQTERAPAAVQVPGVLHAAA